MAETHLGRRDIRARVVVLAPVLGALVSAVLFGVATPLSKVLLRELAPAQLAGLLYLGAAAGLLPVVLRRGGASGARGGRRGGACSQSCSGAGVSAREGRAAPLSGRRAGTQAPLRTVLRQSRRGLLRLIGAIAFGGVLAPLLLLMGLRLAAATSVSLWLNMELVATAVLGHLLFHERLERSGWIGVAGVAFAGMMLAGAEADSGAVAAVLVTLACVCWGLDNHLTALIDGMSATQATFWKCTVAGAVNLLLGVVARSFEASFLVTGLALVVGAFSYGASIVLYVMAAQHLGATRGQLLFATAPFFGLVLSVGLLGEPMTSAHLTAALLMAAGIGVVFATRHGHAHGHQPLAHTHAHRHDDGHHAHAHDEPVPLIHAHWHQHDAVTHTHPHWPDLHHRHRHS